MKHPKGLVYRGYLDRLQGSWFSVRGEQSEHRTLYPCLIHSGLYDALLRCSMPVLGSLFLLGSKSIDFRIGDRILSFGTFRV